MMKFVSVLKNRIRVLFSDKLFILAMIAIPVLLSLISGYAQRREKLGYIPIALVDEDNTIGSNLLCERLMQKEGLKVYKDERKKAMARLNDDSIEAAVIVEKNFESSLKSGSYSEVITLIKSPSTYSAELLKEIISIEALRIHTGDFTYNWIKDSAEKSGIDPSSIDRNDIISRVEEYLEPNPIMTISYEEVKAAPNGSETIIIPSFTAASLGLLVFFIMLGLLFGSGWLCEEKANGTFQRVYSVKGAIIPLFMGNLSALCIMGLLQTFVFVAVQKILFDVVIFKSVYSWIVIFAFILSAASVSMLLASFFETQNQLQAVAPVFALITGLMGGCLWNLLGVPKSLLTMALLTPQGWALKALTELYAIPDFRIALPALLTLTGITLVFSGIAYLRLIRSKGGYGT